ncbi:MAG: LytTR family DNA-binding domain-containing protein [bacterium]|nr:LytTR family DNA-binding domain-containing protein [bacterium]
MHFNIAVCDDEQLQVQININYLKEIIKKNHLDVTLTGFTSLDGLNEHLSINDVDIIFMDIDLGNASGIKGAAELFSTRPDLLVIFITGHREFACEAFDIDALGYILKPIVPDKLEHTLLKAIRQITDRIEKQSSRFLVFYGDKNKMRVPENEIRIIERSGSHALITTTKDSYRVYDSLKNLSERLSDDFIRINQSDLINVAEIDSIRGTTMYTKNCGEKVISRKYRKDVLEAFFNQ